MKKFLASTIDGSTSYELFHVLSGGGRTRELVKRLELVGKNVAITASTGIAASNIHQTIKKTDILLFDLSVFF